MLGEAVAADVLPGLRRRLHRAYLAALTGNQEHSSPAEIARHAAAVGDVATACAATLAAGDAAMAVGGPRDAVRHFERALAWVEDPASRAAIALRAATAASTAGARVRAVELLREAVAATPAAEFPGERAELLAQLALGLRILDLPGDPFGLTSEAVALLPDTAAPRRVRVLLAHIQILLDRRALDDASDLCDEVVALAQEAGLATALAEVRLHRAHLQELRGTSWDDVARMQAVVDHVEGGEDPVQIRALLRLGSLLQHHGRLTESLDAYERALRAASRLDQEWAPYGLDRSCEWFEG